MSIQRTTEHFKFRNRAVRQATYLGIDKVILITIAEFCHDDGVFWHGHRAIARTSGVSLGQAYKSIQKFIKDGVLVLLKKGKPGKSKTTSTYQFSLDNLPEHPSVYDLVKQHPEIDRSYSERMDDAEATPTQEEDHARSYSERKRSSGERMDDARSYSERQSFTTRTEGVDLDVDLPQGVNTSVDGSAASPPFAGKPLNPLEGQSPSPNPSQNRVGAHARKAEEARQRVETVRWRPACFVEGEEAAKSNPNPKTNGNMVAPRSADLPVVANSLGEDCAFCFSQHGQQHHKNCFVVTERLS
jgi:hypothetical protein